MTTIALRKRVIQRELAELAMRLRDGEIGEGATVKAVDGALVLR